MVSLTLSVVVVSYNTRDMTLRCLRTLSRELEGFSAEIFVVDNASCDGSVEAIKSEFPEVKLLVNEGNRGFGAANNQALRLARGEFFLLLNSDAFPHPQAIERLLDCGSSHPRAAVVGPRLLNGDGSLQLSCYRFPSPLKSIWENTLLAAALPDHPIFGDFRNWPHDEEREVDFVIGACWLVRREAAEEVGFFDEEFFLYGEETDWAKRFWAAGWSVLFTPVAEVVHLGGGSGKVQADKVFNEFQRAQERFMCKHYGGAGLMVYRITTIFGACLRMLLFLVAALCRAHKRRHYLSQIAQWKRILLWSLGKRGPGLQETA